LVDGCCVLGSATISSQVNNEELLAHCEIPSND
jgi:hypothetical protein